MNAYVNAEHPTFYFIGVTTGQSSIMRVFPKWAKILGLDAQMKGIDFAPHSPAEQYREAVEFLKNDPLSMGALVTTHKLDLYRACQDMFDYIDPLARKLGEVSSLSKQNGKFCAHAKDPISSGLALEHFVPPNYWANYGGDVLLMGAGGTSVMGRSLSTSASTSEMWMWLPKVRGMVGLTSRNRRLAFLRISLRSAAVPQLKYPCRSMGETVQ